MRKLVAGLAAVPLAAALVSGCFVTGPGPMATYSIQAQPPPGACHYTYVGSFPLPDPNCTPGATNPDVTQANIEETICSSGYASSIRPPEDITEPEKEANASSYSYNGPLDTAEYDHLIPLELGGDPNDPRNLWVEPNDNPNATSVNNSKDILENELNDLVCSGQISLFTAQFAISSNWVTAYQTYVGQLPVFGQGPPSGAPWCSATASPSNDGYVGDYEVYINSNQPDTEATASDANDSWSDDTNSSGYVDIRLYHTSPGEQINVTVGPATCSTTA